MTYVDGFVIAVPTKNLDRYRTMSARAGKIWKEYGALEYKECLAEDMDDKGFCSTFPQMINLQQEETVIFSYIVFQSRAHRDEVNAKVMNDPRIKETCGEGEMPFDLKRMAYGGFEVFIDC